MIMVRVPLEDKGKPMGGERILLFVSCGRVV